MKKFVATALTVVAPSVDKSSKVSDFKNEDVKSDVLGICKEGSPSKKVNFKCDIEGKSLPTTKIFVSCKFCLPPIC